MSTITETLAEIKTIDKRLASKREFVKLYMARRDSMKDPLEKEGGSSTLINRELQAIADLEQRVVDLRSKIQQANETTKLTIEGTERTIFEWLTWRREVAPNRHKFFETLRSQLNSLRDNGRRQGFNVAATVEQPNDIVVNISETELAKEIENLQNTLGQLDGQLSLKNATVMVA